MSNNGLRRILSLKDERIKRRDKAHLDPGERADLVNSFLFDALGLESVEALVSNPMLWDLVSYATEFIGLYAIQSGDEKLETLAKMWSKQIYSLHYSVPDGHEILGPDRETHVERWDALRRALKIKRGEEDE